MSLLAAVRLDREVGTSAVEAGPAVHNWGTAITCMSSALMEQCKNIFLCF